MKLLTFQTDGGLRLGVVTARGVLDGGAAADFYRTGADGLSDLSAHIERALNDSTTPFLDEATLQLAPPVPAPGKIICVGLNYRRHAIETGAAIPTTPILFSKFNNALAAPGEVVPIPRTAEQTDYEAELVVVIGRRAKYVSEADALDHVLGYCNGNDVSARDLQLRTSQWLLGKTPDKFMPIGPYLMTADEAGDPANLRVRGWLNGEPRQDSNTADMIFSVAQVISYASQYMTLEPGDIITTGTPEGVILGMKDKVWLKPGDEYIVEIGNLGRLVNRMAADS